MNRRYERTTANKRNHHTFAPQPFTKSWFTQYSSDTIPVQFLDPFFGTTPISPTNAEQTIKPCPNEAPAAVLQVGKPGLNPSASLTNLSTTSSLGMQTSTSLMQPEGLKIS